ncbi:hypothetical protein ABZP36_029427 [Zizania latifolia]
MAATASSSATSRWGTTRRKKTTCLEREWFPVPTSPPRPVASATPTYANGKIFWLVDPAFGFVFRQYEVVHGPPSSSIPGRGRVFLLQLRDALCVSCSDRDANIINVWAMQSNDGVDNGCGGWSMEYHLQLAEFSSEYSSERTTLMGIDPTNGHIWLNTGQSLGHYDSMIARQGRW